MEKFIDRKKPKFFTPSQGVNDYSMSRNTLMRLAEQLGAVHRYGRKVLIETEVFEDGLRKL